MFSVIRNTHYILTTIPSNFTSIHWGGKELNSMDFIIDQMEIYDCTAKIRMRKMLEDNLDVGVSCSP